MSLSRGQFNYQPSWTKSGQGRLFQTRGAAHTDETRWPRGYTPERYRQATADVGEVEHHEFDELTMSTRKVGLRRYEEEDRPHARQRIAHGADVIRQAVARSTVPRDVVQRTNFSVTPPGFGMNGVYFGKSQRLLFNPDFGEEYPSDVDIPLQEQVRGGKTVIHELGHAADKRLEGRDFVPSDLSLGSVEEFADDFAAEHYVADPRGKAYGSLTTYPGATPMDVAPPRYEGYTKWGQRSREALPIIAERGRKGLPSTSQQHRYLAQNFDTAHPPPPRRHPTLFDPAPYEESEQDLDAYFKGRTSE